VVGGVADQASFGYLVFGGEEGEDGDKVEL
jgi:hypothetical protein